MWKGFHNNDFVYYCPKSVIWCVLLVRGVFWRLMCFKPVMPLTLNLCLVLCYFLCQLWLLLPQSAVSMNETVSCSYAHLTAYTVYLSAQGNSMHPEWKISTILENCATAHCYRRGGLVESVLGCVWWRKELIIAGSFGVWWTRLQSLSSQWPPCSSGRLLGREKCILGWLYLNFH